MGSLVSQWVGGKVCVWPDKVMMGELCEPGLICPDKPHGISLGGRMSLIFSPSATWPAGLIGKAALPSQQLLWLFQQKVLTEVWFQAINICAYLLIRRLLLTVKFHLTLHLKIIFGFWQELLEHIFDNSETLCCFPLAPMNVCIQTQVWIMFFACLYAVYHT